MKTPFFPRTWRGKDIRSGLLPLGEDNLEALLVKLQNTVQDFIVRVFNYEKITVTLIKVEQDNQHTPVFQTDLVKFEGHTRYRISVLMFNNVLYEFSISNIPTTPDSSHVIVFFDALTEYVKIFSGVMSKTLPKNNGNIIATPEFTYTNEILLYNIERTIIVEYIYHLFNTYNSDHLTSDRATAPPLRYDIDLINQILDFSTEISTKKVENKEIYCGFIFHDNENEVVENSVQRIKFKKPIKYGDFSSLKKLFGNKQRQKYLLQCNQR